MSNRIVVINGPNLNLLGSREKHIYGDLSLAKINQNLTKRAHQLGLEIEFRQSNKEGELVEYLHSCKEYADGVILNAAAYTHTSIAIRDAISAAEVEVIEVHVSNIHGRESFRHQSLIAAVCLGQISGLGADSYELALQAFALRLAPPLLD